MAKRTVAANYEEIIELRDSYIKMRADLYGNGKEGVMEALRNVTKAVNDTNSTLRDHISAHDDKANYEKRTWSDVNHILNILRQSGVVDALGNKVEPEKEPEFMSGKWLKQNVAPGLVEKLIIAFGAVLFTLVVTNWHLGG